MNIANNTSLSCRTYLAAYIVDVTLVLYEISMTLTATVDPPRSLSIDRVQDTLTIYPVGSPEMHPQVKDVAREGHSRRPSHVRGREDNATQLSQSSRRPRTITTKIIQEV